MTQHILLIDDSESIQLAVSTVLTEHDYAVTTASDATEGLTYIQQQPYDLVLLDYGLPDVDGLQVLQQLARRAPNLPVVMITGSGSERVAVTALKSGAVDYIVKTDDFIPTLPQMIRDTLEKCAIQRRNRDLETQLRESYKQLKQLNSELEEKVQGRTEELERAYQLSNELMTKAVDSNMQLAELYSEVDESRRKLDSKIRELSLLNDLARAMSAAQDQHDVLRMAVQAIVREIDAEHCAILLLSPGKNHLQVGASRGTPDDLLLAASSADGERLLLQIIQDGAPVLVQDIHGDRRFARLVQDFPTVDSCMLVPLRMEQFQVGILTIYGDDTRETLTKDDFAFISSLAEQTAVSLVNLILHQRRMQDEQLERLEQIVEYVLRQFQPSFTALQQAADQLQAGGLPAGDQAAVGRGLAEHADVLTGISTELLELTRGQRGALQVETVQVQELIEDFLATVESTFAERSLSIQTNLGYPGELACDPRKMRFALACIVDNASAAMSPGDTLTIASELKNHGIQLEFIDTGCGMTPDVQAHVFEPFTSGAGTQKAGLGLALAKKIFDEHRARVEVQSVLTQGTTIRVWLPRVQHANRAAG